MTSTTLSDQLDWTTPTRWCPTFDGETYRAELDFSRLARQLDQVFFIMSDGHWRSLQGIAEAIARRGGRASEAAISARLRDFRKPKFKRLFPVRRVERQRAGSLWRYRLVLDT